MSNINLSDKPVDDIIDLALNEDLSEGDATSEALIPPYLRGKASIIIVENVKDVWYDELVEVIAPNGEKRLGKVLKITKKIAVVQVFEGTKGLDTKIRISYASWQMVEEVMDGDQEHGKKIYKRNWVTSTV